MNFYREASLSQVLSPTNVEFSGCTVISPKNGEYAGRNIIILENEKDDEECDIFKLDMKIKESKR